MTIRTTTISVWVCCSFVSLILSPFASDLCVLPVLAFQVETLLWKKAGQMEKKTKLYNIKYSVSNSDEVLTK